MQITWTNSKTIKIVTERNTIFINPESKEKADIVVDPKDEKDFENQGCFIIKNSGEYELKDDFIYKNVFINKDGKSVGVYKLNIEDVSIVHLANTDRDIKEENLENYENIIDAKIDILILGIGDGYLDTKTAQGLKNELGPRIVIPINYTAEESKKLSDFKTGFALSEEKDTLKVAKKNLPTEETVLVILKKS